MVLIAALTAILDGNHIHLAFGNGVPGGVVWPLLHQDPITLIVFVFQNGGCSFYCKVWAERTNPRVLQGFWGSWDEFICHSFGERDTFRTLPVWVSSSLFTMVTFEQALLLKKWT